MNASTIEHMFQFQYMKTSDEIVRKAREKIVALREKIETRQKRLADLRREYEIDDAALIQLLQAARQQARSHVSNSYSYTKNASTGAMEEKTIGAGVVNNLLTENDFIESEREQVASLERMVRNLKPIWKFSANGEQLPDQGFVLTPDELTYLGF